MCHRHPIGAGFRKIRAGHRLAGSIRVTLETTLIDLIRNEAINLRMHAPCHAEENAAIRRDSRVFVQQSYNFV